MTSSQANPSSQQFPNKPVYPTSVVLLRWIGYILLILFLFDVVALLYPPELMNPNWEFQTAGNIIERIVVPILGMGFIFFGESQLRRKWEMPILKGLSWASLLFSVVLILAIPVILVTSSQRLAQQIDTNFGDQFDEQVSQAEAVQEQIESATRDDLQTFIENQGEAAQGLSPEDARQELLNSVAEATTQVRTQIEDEINARKTLVRKNGIKWILGSIISGVLFIYIWRFTKWARVSPKSVPAGTAKPAKA